MKRREIYLLMLFITTNIFSQDTWVKEVDKNGFSKLVQIANSTEEIYFNKSYIKKVEGLGNLPNLRTLIIADAANFETNFRCLSSLENIETLVLLNVTIEDTDFLKGLVNLNTLILRSVVVNTDSDHFRLPSRLEYLELSHSNIDSIPTFFNGEYDITEINLSYNSIEYEDIGKRERKLLSKSNAVILTGNPILNDLIGGTLKNLNIYSDPENLMHREFQRFFINTKDVK